MHNLRFLLFNLPLLLSFGYRQITYFYPRLQLCRVWQILGFSMTQVPGKGSLGPAILRARLVIACPLCETPKPVFVFRASTIALMGDGGTPPLQDARLRSLQWREESRRLECVWNTKILSVGTSVDFPMLEQLLTIRRTKGLVCR